MTERWTYEPCGDSDGEMIGTDHFVIDEKGDEIACPRNEKQARLIAAAPDLLASLENLAGIITTIREEQVSSKMGLGRTEAEKRERAAVYAAEITRQSAKIDEALDEARAEYVELVDQYAPHVAKEAAAILQRGMTPVVVTERRITSKLSSLHLASGLLTVLAQLYNHCKTGIPARVKGTIE